MTKKQIALDTAKTAIKWFLVTLFMFVYWMAMMLLASLIFLNIWKVDFTTLVVLACILGSVSSVVYGWMLVHRKFYY